MKMKRKILLGLAVIVCAVALYLLLWPVPIEPQAWTPPPAPALAGDYQPNTRLAAIEKLSPGLGVKPEGVAIDREGRIYTGVEDGRIVRLRADGTAPEDFARIEGRPLGLEFDPEGNLIVAGERQGLLSISPNKVVSVLTTEADGLPFRCVNDLSVAADGTVYFSDASYKFPISVYKEDLFEHRPNGRLLAYDPQTKATRVVLGGLYFANGVAVSPDQSFVLVSETGKYRVMRVWLTGQKKDSAEIWVDNLPGFPDNITSNGKDLFWLALVTPRNRLLDALMPRPFLRKLVLRLPQFLQPAPKRYAFVLGLDTNGRIIQNLQDPSGKSFAVISSALEHQGVLYFGSIGEDAVGRLPIPEK